MLKEQGLVVHSIYRYVISTATRIQSAEFVVHKTRRIDHFTRTRFSFFGQICSRVSASMLSWASRFARMDRWTEDFRID